MKSVTKPKTINLPKIKSSFHHSEDFQDSLPSDDQEQINKLDEWTQMVPVAKRRKKIMKNSDSLVFLYKNQKAGKVTTTRHSRFHQQQFSQMGMFLAKINNELNKIKAINYGSIYQNMEYCSGFYENHFNSLLKTLESYKNEVEKILKDKDEEVNSLRH